MTKLLSIWLTVLLLSCGRVAVSPTPVSPVPSVGPSPVEPTTKTVTVMAFGAPWCPYCKQDIPVLYDMLKGAAGIDFKVYVPTGMTSSQPPSDDVTRKYVASLGIPESMGVSDPKWSAFKRFVGGQYAIPAAAVVLPSGTVKSYRAGSTFDPNEIAYFAIQSTK